MIWRTAEKSSGLVKLAGAQFAPKPLPEKGFDVGLVVDDEHMQCPGVHGCKVGVHRC